VPLTTDLGQSKLDALATGMLEAIRNEGGDASPMLQRAIRLDDHVERRLVSAREGMVAPLTPGTPTTGR
jgi:hypothetical protein